MALSTFTTQSWTFVNTNFLGLLQHIPDTDKEDFDFAFEHVNPDEYFSNCVIGTQKYLFNTNLAQITQARKKLKKLVKLF